MRRLATLTRAAIAMAIVLLVCGRADAAKCTVSTTSINFGTYNVFSINPIDSMGTLTYNCNGGADYVMVTLDAGDNGSFSARLLARNTERLSYNLFVDPSHSVVWGNGTAGTSFHSASDPPNKTDVTVPIFGRIPAGQDVSAGTYTDTVTVVINY